MTQLSTKSAIRLQKMKMTSLPHPNFHTATDNYTNNFYYNIFSLFLLSTSKIQQLNTIIQKPDCML